MPHNRFHTSHPHSLLLLKRNSHSLIAERHTRHCLLRHDSTFLALVLHEGDALPARNQAHLEEARIASEEGRQFWLAIILGQLAQEENLVGR